MNDLMGWLLFVIVFTLSAFVVSLAVRATLAIWGIY